MTLPPVGHGAQADRADKYAEKEKRARNWADSDLSQVFTGEKTKTGTTLLTNSIF